jgi:hypothetical protein
VHQSGLARARWAHDGGELAALKGDGHAIEGFDLGVATSVGLYRVNRSCRCASVTPGPINGASQ